MSVGFFGKIVVTYLALVGVIRHQTGLLDSFRVASVKINIPKTEVMAIS